MNPGEIITLRRASYMVSGDQIAYLDTLLGQFKVHTNTVVPLGRNRIAKTMLIDNIGTVLSPNGTHLRSGFMCYDDSEMHPDEAKVYLFTFLRDELENERMRLNGRVRDINELLDDVQGELEDGEGAL